MSKEIVTVEIDKELYDSIISFGESDDFSEALEYTLSLAHIAEDAYAEGLLPDDRE